MVVIEVPRVQTLTGCHTCGSHLLATHRITNVCILRRSFAALWAAHGILMTCMSPYLIAPRTDPEFHHLKSPTLPLRTYGVSN